MNFTSGLDPSVGEPGIDPIAPRRVLFVSAEIYPLAKTGGLADVCAALPQALAEHDVDVRLLMPGYPSALAQIVAPRVAVEFEPLLGVDGLRLLIGRAPDSALPLWLLDCPSLFRRPGGPYQDADGQDWPDNALRFAVFCHAAAWLAGHGNELGWKADLVHCHDWHCGLLPLLLASAGSGRRTRSVFTVHNLAFQGNYPLTQATRLGLDAPRVADSIEFYGQLSFLKAGICSADRVTTVSPSYAREITGSAFGCGMDGVLRARGRALSGILNGIDTRIWNPRSDAHIAAGYSHVELTAKATCKRDLQQRLGFCTDPQRPLAILLSRLTRQKMADLLLERLPALLQQVPDLQFALLGHGDADLEAGFHALAATQPQRVAATIGYSEPEAHRLLAGADLLIHGSRFEPCGLTQMYAMRYGTLPVVRRVGGLADSVIDDSDAVDGTGFVFDACDGDALLHCTQHALEVWRQRPQRWARLQRNAMQSDFGWSRSAREYLRLYYGLGRPLPLTERIDGSPRTEIEHAYH